MDKELMEYEQKKYDKKTKLQKWQEFSHTLDYIFCNLKNETSKEDYMDLLEIKQSIITFSIGKEFGESNQIYLDNCKYFLYKAIESIKNRHSDIELDLRIIERFVEEFYLK